MGFRSIPDVVAFIDEFRRRHTGMSPAEIPIYEDDLLDIVRQQYWFEAPSISGEMKIYGIPIKIFPPREYFDGV